MFLSKLLIVFFVLSTLLLADENVLTAQTVVVSATKTLIETDEVVEDLEIISVEDIENSGASTTEELIQAIPGITVYRHPQTQIRINGMEGNYTLVLIDGVPIHADVGGGVPLENIPLGDIERIEIVKGASSVIYGSSAIGGVVNFITRGLSRSTEITGGLRYQSNILSDQFNTPGYEDDNDFEVATDQRARWSGATSADAGVRTTLGIFDIKASGGVYFDSGVVDTIIKRPVVLFGNRPYWTMNEVNRSFGNLYAGVDISEDLLVSVDTRFALDKDKRSLSRDVVQYFSNNSYNGVVKWNYFVNERTTFDGYFSGQRFDHTYNNYDYNLEATTKDNLSTYKTFDSEFLAEISLNDANTFVTGINFIRESMYNDDIENDYQNGYEVACFVQESFNYRDENRLIVTTGFRATYNSRFSGAINPKVGARYNFSSGLYARVSYGTGFNTPTFKQNFYDTFIHPKPHDFLLQGNPDLSPEKSHSLNASLGGEANVLSYEASVHLSLVDQKISTEVISEEGGELEDGSIYSYQRGYVNIAESRSMGSDLSLTYKGNDWFNLTGFFSYLYMEDRETPEDEFLESELFSPYSYKFSGIIYFDQWRKYLPIMNVMFNHEGRQVWNRDEEDESLRYLESYSTLNVSLKKQITDNISFTFGVNNVLDDGSDDLGFGYGRICYTDLRFSY